MAILGRPERAVLFRKQWFSTSASAVITRVRTPPPPSVSSRTMHSWIPYDSVQSRIAGAFHSSDVCSAHK
eukprot:1862585-Alexandrium_andersonii.AAC.1